ncbi:MAG: response regulator [Candidatus Dormibacteria bacterium]
MTTTEARIMKVLLVDDDMPNLELYRLAFAMHGHQVLTAASGTEALQVFEREKPDAVIMDLILGDMVGTEAIDRMRQLGDSIFYLLSEAEPAVLDSAANRIGVPRFQKLGVPVGDVVRTVNAAFLNRTGQ